MKDQKLYYSHLLKITKVFSTAALVTAVLFTGHTYVHTEQVQATTTKTTSQKTKDFLIKFRQVSTKGLNYYNSNIKIGMKASDAVKKLGKPIKKDNWEWKAYYHYKTFSLGLDGYLHELTSKSRVTSIYIPLKDKKITFNQLKTAYGKPIQQFLNEATDTYEVYYKAGNHALRFDFYSLNKPAENVEVLGDAISLNPDFFKN